MCHTESLCLAGLGKKKPPNRCLVMVGGDWGGGGKRDKGNGPENWEKNQAVR